MATQAQAAIDWQKEWFEFEDVAYLNLAAQAPLPRVGVRAVQTALEWKKFPQKLPEDAFMGLPASVRGKIAKLIGADPAEIAVTSGASSGMAAVANGYAWKSDDEVLIPRGEFPAHFTTWLPLQDAGKLRVRIISPSGRFLTTDDVIRAITPKTRVLSISHARFDNAARCDAKAIADAVHAVGGMLLLDTSQTTGAVSMNVKSLGADFVVCAGYKWTLGPFGTGFFWARSDRIKELSGAPAYWMALENAHDFSRLSTGEAKLLDAAQRFDAPETSNFFNLAAWDAALDVVLRAGSQAVWDHNLALIDQLIARLPLDRCVLASPADATVRGPYVCVQARKPERTLELYQKLREANVFVALREGALRVSPYLYNTERDIDRLIRVLTV